MFVRSKRTLATFALGVFGLVRCADQQESAPTGTATDSASPLGSLTASSTASALASASDGPLRVDPTVEAELAKATACLAQKGLLHWDECDREEKAFMAFATTYYEDPGGDLSAAKDRQRVVVDSLFAALEDADPAKRTVAAYTLSQLNGRLGLPDASKQDPRTMALLRRRLATETEPGVTRGIIWLMNALGPREDDRRKILAWVLAQPEGKDRQDAADDAFPALTPQGAEPLDGAVDLALVRIGVPDGNGRIRALELLERAHDRAGVDVCARLEAVVRAADQQQFWVRATDTAVSLGVSCEAAVEAGVKALVPALKKDQIVELGAVASMVKRRGLSQERRELIAKSVSPAALKGPWSDQAEQIVAAGKKPETPR